MTATIRGTVASVLPTLEPPLEPPFMRIDLDAVRAVVREEVRAALTDNAALRQASEQALEALEDWDSPMALPAVVALRAALAQQAEPVEPVAWANIDSDRLRVDPATGNVSIGAQQAEPLTIERLRDALVASRIIQPAAVEDPDGYDDGVTLYRIEALHRRLT